MKKASSKLIHLALGAALAFTFMGCPGQVHEHTFATEWTSNDTHHWHAATCEHTEEETGKEPHSFGEWSEGKRSCSKCEYEQTCEHTWKEWTIITQPTEESSGSRERICEVCGIVETEELARLDHVHAKGAFHEAVASTCVTNGTVAFFDCAKSTCEMKLDEEGNPLATIEAELDPANHEGTTTWTKTAATHKETYDCCEVVKTAEAEHT